jgi:hypothetical protein
MFINKRQRKIDRSISYYLRNNKKFNVLPRMSDPKLFGFYYYFNSGELVGICLFKISDKKLVKALDLF